ncbi:MAG TPA: cation diffusion facilitator family transporter [Thermoguttaceae bacterium]|nr:cation diffusion facilitator family transporter [Thermoguttaceae bacterium]
MTESTKSGTAGEARSSAQAGQVRRVTLWGLVVNVLLAAIKFVFGVVGASQALVADAVHSLSDLVTDVAVVIGAGFWSAPADAEHPYGHGRIETLITSAIGLVLGTVGVGLGYRAILTLPQSHDSRPGWTAFAAACLSIVAKELLYRWTANVGKRVKSSAVVANAWHHRSDALSSVPVAIAVLGTHIWPDCGFLDHIGAVIVSVLILHAAWEITWPALRELVDAAAKEHERQAILKMAQDTEGVQAVHKLRTRSIGAGLQVDLHVLVEPELSVREGHAIANVVKERLLSQGPNVIDVLVHVEPYDADHHKPPTGASQADEST